MKAILMSIRPKYVAKILKGIKMFEIRKKFPSDYVGWVYIYCTKDRKQCLVRNNINKTYHLDTCYWDEFESNLNGKVVARFYTSGVEEIYDKETFDITKRWSTSELCIDSIARLSCLTKQELFDYLGYKEGYAIHIDRVEIFDKQKEISGFGTLTNKCNGFIGGKKPLTKAPQSWCYIEV